MLNRMWKILDGLWVNTDVTMRHGSKFSGSEYTGAYHSAWVTGAAKYCAIHTTTHTAMMV